MIVVLERDPEIRNDIVQTLEWIDRRHRVEACDNGYACLQSVRRYKPGIVIIGPSISPEVAGEVRSRALGALIVGVGTKENEVFHLTLPLPLPHDTLREVLEKVRLRSSRRVVEDKRKHRHGRLKPKPIRVTVCNGTLRFSMNADDGTALGDFLQRLSKYSIVSYALFRNGAELATTVDTPLEDGDEFRLRISSCE